MNPYNESVDTFSFALVLLCLASGDIGYVLKLKQQWITRTAYVLGWRPDIPAEIDFACPDLAKLISEMWDGDACKRPLMKQVVARLQACATVDLDDGICWPLPKNGHTSGDKGDAVQTVVSGTDKDAQIEALQATIRELRATQLATIRDLRATTEAAKAQLAMQQERIQALEQAAQYS